MAPSRIRNPKPQASLLHAEVPCNYTLGRLAAALQNVFGSVFGFRHFFYAFFYIFYYIYIYERCTNL